MNQNFYEELKNTIPEARIQLDEPMKSHTTFRIGGPAKYFVIPETKEEIKAVIECCKKADMPYYILGNGSNLLVSDKGYEGVVIQIFKNMNQIVLDGETITAQAGAILSSVANKALEAELTGFEFAAGIPGTLGGACVMNAGAYGGEMKDVLVSVVVLTQDGEFLTIPKEELELGYRTSVIAKKNYIVLEATICLTKGDKEAIKARMDELKVQRTTKQPLEYPSAGSTFKRGNDFITAKLIDECGLKGYQIGGAQISEKHAGFIINKNNATAEDVIKLIEYTKEQIYNKFGKKIEEEIEILK